MKRLALLALLLLLTVYSLLAGTLATPYTWRLDLGTGGDDRYFSAGFGLPATGGGFSYRAAAMNARLTLPNRATAPHALALRLYGDPVLSTTQRRLTLATSAGHSIELPVAAGWRVYQLALPAQVQTLQISGPPAGVPVDWVQNSPLTGPPAATRGLHLALGPTWALALAGAAVWYLASVVPGISARRAASIALAITTVAGAGVLLWGWRSPATLSWAFPPAPLLLGVASLALAGVWIGGAGPFTGHGPSSRLATGGALRITLFTALVGLTALLPRILTLDDLYTIDEGYHWVGRVQRFAAALAGGDWPATIQTGHPGVTTMWLGAAGHWLAGWIDIAPAVAGSGATHLALLRLPLALFNSLAVVIGYLLLRRVVDPAVALLAALLWAGAPFLVAHSRVLHLDALLTSLMTLSLLLLLAATTPRTSLAPRSAWLLLGLAGASAGLALLTKAPALALPPLAGLWLLICSAQHAEGQNFPTLLRSAAGWLAPRYALWLGSALLVAFIAWPALWVEPGNALLAVRDEILANGAQPHQSGNFFAGRPVADPGMLFYPTVVLWRSDPLLLLGLLLLPAAFWFSQTKRRPLWALLGFVLLFGLLMTLAAKKFDRYLLPLWPALCILAAAGLVAAAARVNVLRHRPAATLTGIILLQALTLAWYHPYYLSYFNPLLGGSATGQRMLLVGWGEGMEQAGAWLAARPDNAAGPILARYEPTLQPFVTAPVYDLVDHALTQQVSYAVLYISDLQRMRDPAVVEYLRQAPPLQTVTIHGITYAEIYQPPRPFARPVGALFAENLALRGVTVTATDSGLRLTPAWSVLADQPGGRFVFVHAIAADGTRLAQVDLPLDGSLFTDWQAGQQFGAPIELLLPPGSQDYRLALGVYDPATGARLPLSGVPALPEALAGPHAVALPTE